MHSSVGVPPSVPHPSQIEVGPPSMIGHVNTIDHDKQQGSMFKSLSLNLIMVYMSKLVHG